MGTDIHLHLEYHTTPPGRQRQDQARLNHPNYAQPVIANCFHIPRDYELFAALAGVRNSDHRPVRTAPRGLPDDVSREIFHQYYVEIFPPDTPAEWLQAGWKWCRPDEAQRLVEQHGKQLVEQDSRRFVAGEDWHSPSYLYRREIQQALQHAGYNVAQLSPEFLLVQGGLEVLDKKSGDRCARIVFWFDC